MQKRISLPLQGHVEAHEGGVVVFRERSGEQCDLRVEVANVGREEMTALS